MPEGNRGIIPNVETGERHRAPDPGSGSPLEWGIPLWAAACGGIAAGVWPLSSQDGLRLLMTFLLVGMGWARFWHALAATDWATLLEGWRTWSAGESRLALPYARPGSPAHRLARWLGQLTSWGRTVFLPAAGPALRTAGVSLAAALILSAALGENSLLLTLGVFALAQMALLQSGGTGRVGIGWHALMGVGIPWLAGHLALSPLSLSSAVLAGAFSLVAYGWTCTSAPSGPLAWVSGYVGAVALFLLTGRPLVVPYLVLVMLLPLISAGNPAWKPRALWLVGGMLLAAVAL